MDRCNRCVRSSYRDDVKLNAVGICEKCCDVAGKTTFNATVSWSQFCEAIREASVNKNSRYDCMALYSGGKDSTYMIKMLCKIEGIRVLAVTIDHWFNSEQAEKNMKRVLQRLPLDHISFRPAWPLMRNIYEKLIFKTGEICLACEAYLTTEIYNLADKFKIPIMSWGLAPQQFKTPPKFLLNIDKSYWEKMKERFINPLEQALGENSDDMISFRNNYISTIPGQITHLPKLLFPFIGMGYDPDFAEREARKVGWVRPLDAGGLSSNCFANHLHTYLKLKTNPIQDIEDQLSELIQKKQISREKALHVLEHPATREQIVSILKRLSINITIDDLIKRDIALSSNIR